MRWIVGDVQGCAKKLKKLVRNIGFDPDRDELWLAGDLINRGPNSVGTLRFWMELGGKGVIGNHEVYALCASTGRWPRKADTLDDVFDAPDADELLAALRALPLLVHLPSEGDGPDAWLVHAGMHPMWKDLHKVADRINGVPHDDDWLESKEVRFATRVRCCDSAGKLTKYDLGPEGCPPPYRPWDKLYRGDTLVVHGHWARRGHYRGKRTLGLDSGCVYGGKLTAWCQDEDRIVQV